MVVQELEGSRQMLCGLDGVLSGEERSTVEARKLEHGLRRIVLGSLILSSKGMRIIVFQLSGFYYRVLHPLHTNPRNQTARMSRTYQNYLQVFLQLRLYVILLSLPGRYEECKDEGRSCNACYFCA